MPEMAGIGVHQGKAGGIMWGATFTNVLAFGFPMLEVETYPENRPDGTVRPAGDGGGADGWTYGSDRFVAFRLPAIPPTTEADPYGFGVATGWDTAGGWRDFLAYARRKNTLRFCPVLADYVDGDTTTYLEVKLREPMQEPPEAGWQTRRAIRVVLRAVEDAFAVGY